MSIISYDYISSEDKILMLSLYINDNNFTYENIDNLFKSKYLAINADRVGKVIREENENSGKVINFKATKKVFAHRIKENIDLQKSRHND